jgi:hypothetical protein
MIVTTTEGVKMLTGPTHVVGANDVEQTRPG